MKLFDAKFCRRYRNRITDIEMASMLKIIIVYLVAAAIIYGVKRYFQCGTYEAAGRFLLWGHAISVLVGVIALLLQS